MYGVRGEPCKLFVGHNGYTHSPWAVEISFVELEGFTSEKWWYLGGT